MRYSAWMRPDGIVVKDERNGKCVLYTASGPSDYTDEPPAERLPYHPVMLDNLKHLCSDARAPIQQSRFLAYPDHVGQVLLLALIEDLHFIDDAQQVEALLEGLFGLLSPEEDTALWGEALLKKASHMRLNKNPDAVDTLAQADHHFRRTGNDIGCLLVQLENSALCEEQSDALAMADSALRKLRSMGAEKEAADALLQLGSMEWNGKRSSYAKHFFDAALIAYRKIGDTRGMAKNLNNLAILAEENGNTVQAMEKFAQSLTLFQAIGDRRRIACAYNNMGLLLQSKNEYEKAASHFSETLVLYEELENERGQIDALGQLAICAEKLGQIENQLKWQQRRLTILQSQKKTDGIAKIHLNMGVCFLRLGRNQESEEAFREALISFEEVEDHRGMALSLTNLGLLAELRGDLAEADARHSQSQSHREMCKGGLSMSVSFINQGITAMHQQNYVEAELRFRQSYSSSEKSQDTIGMGSALNLLGRLYAQTEKKLPLDACIESLEKLEDFQDTPLLLSWHSHLCLLSYLRSGSVEKEGLELLCVASLIACDTLQSEPDMENSPLLGWLESSKWFKKHGHHEEALIWATQAQNRLP
jgi:tetratricopeptide (TPR) repeat protein